MKKLKICLLCVILVVCFLFTGCNNSHNSYSSEGIKTKVFVDKVENLHVTVNPWLRQNKVDIIEIKYQGMSAGTMYSIHSSCMCYIVYRD